MTTFTVTELITILRGRTHDPTDVAHQAADALEATLALAEELELRLNQVAELAETFYDSTAEWHNGCRAGRLGNVEATCGYGEALDAWDARVGRPG